MIFNRIWAMPNPETFSILPIAELLRQYVHGVVIDPFARNAKIGTITNDLNPDTNAKYHMPAEDFCLMLKEQGIVADVILFDPPYSLTQMKEVYGGIGLKLHKKEVHDMQFQRVRRLLDEILKPKGTAISFGWNSQGFGKEAGYVLKEILLVPHGGPHNDTIVVVEGKGEQPWKRKNTPLTAFGSD